jgi:polysaccharide export outer membrane protein
MIITRKLTHSAAPYPAFKGRVRKRRSGSTLSKSQNLCRGVEGLTFLFPLLFVFFVLSCASSSPPKKDTVSPETQMREIEISRQAKAMNERILMAALSSKKDPSRDYKIGPEDLLEISVFEDEKLSKTVRVSFQGNINFPLIGVLKVKGLTAGELEREIRDLLAEKYFQDPNVSVFIKEYRNQRISVIGAVEKPGVYEVSGQKTVLDLLAISGGLKEDAGQLLFLIRPPKPQEEVPKKGEEKVSAEEAVRTFVVNLEELLIKGDLSQNLPLLHGDVINIPLSGRIYVGGQVKTPGGFPIKGKKITVSQAVALAGGLTEKAAGSDTKIFRYQETDNGKEIVTVDVYAIQKGKVEDLQMKENDIMFVPTSTTKAVLIEFKNTITGLAGFGFGYSF